MKISKTAIKLFLSVCFKGISQVLLIENAISGFIIFLAISIFSLKLGVIAFLSTAIGAIFGKLVKIDNNIVNQGLMGYNSVLTGISLMLLLTGPNRWVIALVGAVVAAIFTVAFMYAMKPTKMPILTFPFVLLVWLILLASVKLKIFKLSPNLLPQNLPDIDPSIAVKEEVTDAIFNGIGQIYFLHDINFSGLLLFIAIFWAGWKIGLYSFLGNAAAILFAYILGADPSTMILGFFGYNAILTIIAVSFFYNTGSSPSALWGLSAACLTVPLTAGVDALFEPYDLPTLTLPFVLSTWIFLCAKKMVRSNR
ncbi:urea transporter [Cytobacillus depressus]|uniref:Urea transporter n=1 Tax=Cytobacillus depressus TaxID=1602942 RepID=A0A6L3V207_9BACI|nr:urea transporter [Cytobacillus depressus]KAB2330223.1 urea transporter [Cytobacillus depressus]